MKKVFINKLMITAFAVSVLTSCENKLDLKPAQTIDQESALKTDGGVKAALIGSYADLGDRDLYGGRVLVGPDLLADNGELFWDGTYQGFTQINLKDIPTNNIFVEGTYKFAYRTINDLNNVLSAIDVVSANDKSRVEGEAKFLRALVYFDLVRLYAKNWNDGNPSTNLGVPIILKPTLNVSASAEIKVKRNTVAEVYAQVIKDLTEAEGLLTAGSGAFATKGSASALLARVYLQKEDYPAAAAAADRVISSNKYSLVATNLEVFPYSGEAKVIPNTSEDIFAVQITDQLGYNAMNELYGSSGDGGRGDIYVEPAHKALYEAGDARLGLISGEDRCMKHANTFGNVRLIRLAEMYLTRAEANYRAGTAVGASPLADVNKIRSRAGLLPLLAVNLTSILKERKLELSFEGFALHDAKRNKANIGSLPYNSPKLVYPIPVRERIANPELIQNEGYF